MREKILEMINTNPHDIAGLHELFTEMNSVDIAETFEEISRENIVQIFRLLPKSMAAEVFAELPPEQQQLIVEALTDSEIGRIMNELFMDDAVDFIEEMPANVVKRVLQNVTEEKRRQINQLLRYPEDSAGSIMTTEYVDLSEDATVSEAFADIRATGVRGRNIYTCYVIRSDRLLLGVVSAKTLLLANPEDKIGDIMDINLVFAHTTDDQEIIAALFQKYGLLSLPVVDKERRLVGIVTVDDVFDVIEEESTEDFERMAALNPSDKPYLRASVWELARNRFPWLLALMLSATITARIISGFEDLFTVLPALVAFIPMLMGTGGNAGTQSSTMVIRGMALGDIHLGDALSVLWRELRIGALCGLGLGLANFLYVLFVRKGDALLSLAVTLSLFATVVLAKSVGCLLPIFAKRLRLDPAVMATPLITTIIDGTSLAVYFSIAKVVLHL